MSAVVVTGLGWVTLGHSVCLLQLLRWDHHSLGTMYSYMFPFSVTWKKENQSFQLERSKKWSMEELRTLLFRIYSNTTKGFVANWNLANGAFQWWIEAVLKCWIHCVCPRSLLVELVNPSVIAHTSVALIHCTDSFFICIKYVLRQFNCLCMAKSSSRIQSPVSCVTFLKQTLIAIRLCKQHCEIEYKLHVWKLDKLRSVSIHKS